MRGVVELWLGEVGVEDFFEFVDLDVEGCKGDSVVDGFGDVDNCGIGFF